MEICPSGNLLKDFNQQLFCLMLVSHRKQPAAMEKSPVTVNWRPGFGYSSATS